MSILEFNPRTLADTVRYAGASGDFNPLHYDFGAAKRAGFEKPLLHGAYLGALLEYHARQALGDRAVCEYRVRYSRPLMIGEGFRVVWNVERDTVHCAIDGGGGDDDIRVSGILNAGQHFEPTERPADFEILGDPYPWILETGALCLFVQATSDPSAVPIPSSRPPLCFLGNASRWSPATESSVRRLGFSYAKLLHGETIVQVFGEPMRAGEVFNVIEAHGNRRQQPHRTGGTMRFADVIHEISAVDGSVRARITNRMIERPDRKVA